MEDTLYPSILLPEPAWDLKRTYWSNVEFSNKNEIKFISFKEIATMINFGPT
jgi:hypothetical protein